MLMFSPLNATRELLIADEIMLVGRGGADFDATANIHIDQALRVADEDRLAGEVAGIMLGGQRQETNDIFTAYETSLVKTVGHFALLVHRAQKKSKLSQTDTPDITDINIVRHISDELRAINGILGIGLPAELDKAGLHAVVRYNSERVAEIAEIYRNNPNVDESALKKIFMGRKDPEKALKAYDEEVSRLIVVFEGDEVVYAADIKRACLNQKDPEASLRRLKKQYYELCELYGDDPYIQPYIVKSVVKQENDPAKKLITVRKTIEQLSKQYENSRSVTALDVARIVVASPLGAERRLKDFENDFAMLAAKYESEDAVTAATIKLALFTSANPHEFLDKIAVDFYKLKNVFLNEPIISDGVLRRYLGKTRDPEASIRKYIELYKYLSQHTDSLTVVSFIAQNAKSVGDADARLDDYKKKMLALGQLFANDEFVDASTIARVTLYNTQEAAYKKLLAFKATVIALMASHGSLPAITLGTIKEIVQAHKDVNAVISLHISNFRSLTNIYKGDSLVTDTDIRFLSSRFPYSADEKTARYRKNLTDLMVEFPDVPVHILKDLCIVGKNFRAHAKEISESRRS